MAKMYKSPKKSTKVILNRVFSVLIGAIFILVIIALFSLILQSSGGKKPSVFGYRLYFVLTDSMEPTLKVNDVMISEVVSGQADTKIKENDIITFIAEYGAQKGMTITHRVIKGVHFDENHQRYVVLTKGDNENASVDMPIPIENIQARMIKKSIFLTKIYNFLTSTYGIIIMLVIPFLFVIVALIYRLVVIIKTPAQTEQQQIEQRVQQLKRQAIEEYKQQRTKEIAENAVKEYINQQKGKE